MAIIVDEMHSLAMNIWAMNMLKDISKYDGFCDFLRSGSKDEFSYFCDSNRFELDKDGLYVAYGETKAVIWDENRDFVIKLPFLNGRDGKEQLDYCRAEWRNYCMAVDKGFAHHFAPMEKVGYFLGYPVYVMEYVDVDEEYTSGEIYEHCSNCSKEEEDEDTSALTANGYSEDDVLYYCSTIWDDFSAFESFLNENLINDLHAANVGWRGGELVLCDYSGYGRINSAKNDADWWRIIEHD